MFEQVTVSRKMIKIVTLTAVPNLVGVKYSGMQLPIAQSAQCPPLPTVNSVKNAKKRDCVSKAAPLAQKQQIAPSLASITDFAKR